MLRQIKMICLAEDLPDILGLKLAAKLVREILYMPRKVGLHPLGQL